VKIGNNYNIVTQLSRDIEQVSMVRQPKLEYNEIHSIRNITWQCGRMGFTTSPSIGNNTQRRKLFATSTVKIKKKKKKKKEKKCWFSAVVFLFIFLLVFSNFTKYKLLI